MSGPPCDTLLAADHINTWCRHADYDCIYRILIMPLV
jgi:hypothetical protein